LRQIGEALAQDDGFVGSLEIQMVGYPENTKESNEKHRKQVGAYGAIRPYRTHFANR
jgi:hypothetical protein